MLVTSYIAGSGGTVCT